MYFVLSMAKKNKNKKMDGKGARQGHNDDGGTDEIKEERTKTSTPGRAKQQQQQ